MLSIVPFSLIDSQQTHEKINGLKSSCRLLMKYGIICLLWNINPYPNLNRSSCIIHLFFIMIPIQGKNKNGKQNRLLSIFHIV